MTARWRLGVLVLVGALCSAEPLTAQDGRPAPVSVDSAAAIRRSLVRPRARPGTDAVDVVEFPFRVGLFPLKLLARSVAGVAGLVTLPNPSPPVRMVRGMPEMGLLPRIRSIGPASGVALELELVRFDPLFAETALSFRGSQKHRVGLVLGDSTGAWGLMAAYGFHRDAEENFWGVGPDSRKVDRSDFQRDRHDGAATGWLQVGPLHNRVGVGVETNRIGRGGDGSLPDIRDTYVNDPPLGALERVNLFRLEFSTALDLTRRNGFELSGVRVEVGAQIFRGFDGTASDFHRLSGELRGYLPVSSSQTLALRALVETNGLDGGEDIPFFHLARLGGSRNGPRGFRSGRFRDRAGVALMSEWRYAIWEDIGQQNRLEAFVLFDAGGVAPSLSRFQGSDLRSSTGFGLRLVKLTGLSVLSYVAFSGEGTELVARTRWHF